MRTVKEVNSQCDEHQNPVPITTLYQMAKNLRITVTETASQ